MLSNSKIIVLMTDELMSMEQ